MNERASSRNVVFSVVAVLALCSGAAFLLYNPSQDPSADLAVPRVPNSPSLGDAPTLEPLAPRVHPPSNSGPRFGAADAPEQPVVLAEPSEVDAKPDPRTKMSGDLTALLDAGEKGPFRLIVQSPRKSPEGETSPLDDFRTWSTDRSLKEHRRMDFIGATVIEASAEELMAFANEGFVSRISLDARIQAHMGVSSAAVGADLVRRDPNRSDTLEGYDGRGITIAVIDSGVQAEHPDFQAPKSLEGSNNADGGGKGKGKGKKKKSGGDTGPDVATKARIVTHDFLLEDSKESDDLYGHGTHVAGIAAGTGKNSPEDQAPHTGIAPGAQILNLRVLDKEGAGLTSDVIAAIEFAIVHRDEYNIRVINLSLGHPVYESFETDPLTQACAAAVETGIAVVASAGNNGQSDGNTVYGGINSPGNAPWVITVGATRTQDTVKRSDDEIAPFSSRGPTAIDGLIKPDLVAPGYRVISCQKDDTALAMSHPHLTLKVPNDDPDDPPVSVKYMTLSGTSMATPIVSGTLALMFEANPSLTVSAAKAILLYTAEKMTEPDILSQGSGYLNTEGAVRLASLLHPHIDELRSGEFWLDSSGGPNHMAGFLDPSTEIGGEMVLWGSSFHWGDRLVLGEGVMWSHMILWGNGVLWNFAILWSNGEPWADDLMAFFHPAYSDGILWTHGKGRKAQEGQLWDDAILWSFSNSHSENILLSDAILWTNTELFDLWSSHFVNPQSIDAAGIDANVLVHGESGPGDSMTLIDSSSRFFPDGPR